MAAASRSQCLPTTAFSHAGAVEAATNAHPGGVQAHSEPYQREPGMRSDPDTYGAALIPLSMC